MDLKNILSETESAPSATPQAPREEPKPELRKRFSSISDLMNNDDSQPHSSSPLQHQTTSPVINKASISSSVTQTPAAHNLNVIKARSSISSLTNDTDVDVDGKETPSIARRLSYEVSASESNSPVVPKKTITRAASLQDMMNTDEPIEFEEPVYKEASSLEEGKPKQETNRTIKQSTNEGPKEGIREDNSTTKATKRKHPTPNQRKTTKAKGSTPEKSAQQKTKNINDEISRLEKLEKGTELSNGADSNKPKRYANPPIWAQTYVPTFKNQRARNGGRGKKHSNAETDVSLTGVKPFNDLTRRITNWVYAQITNIPKDERQYLEMEVKFGRIWNKASDRRIHLPVTNECLIDDSAMLDCRFNASMEKEHFERSKKYITGLTRLHKEKFKTLKFDQVDRTFRETAGGEMPKFYRLTTDKSTGRIVANIQKLKLGSLNLHSPDLIFDYRLTMSLELPSHGNPERFSNHTPETERQKKRTSFFHDSTATRIDMTDVISRHKGRNAGESKSLEMELEIDMGRLLHAYDTLDTDSFTFEELTETLMDNARLLNRELAKPVPK